MIIWINGAFGSGKTQTAYELCRRMRGAYVYDPENAGGYPGLPARPISAPMIFRAAPCDAGSTSTCSPALRSAAPAMSSSP